VLLVLVICQGAAFGEAFEPLAIVYAGRMPGYADALAEIISETGTKAVVATSDSVVRSISGLPQVRVIVLAALNPSDFVFLEEFSSTFQRYFEEGGSFVGIGSVSSMDLEELATTIFPVRGNHTGRGKRVGDLYGSTYVLSGANEEITGGLPPEFVITQGEFKFQSAGGVPLDPWSDLGEVEVLYRDKDTDAPLVVSLEREGGGRSVSMTGGYVVDVERLPFYWGNLVDQEEFRKLLKQSVSWAMEGSKRYDDLSPESEGRLGEEADRLKGLEDGGEKSRSRAEQRRLLILAGLWGVGLAFQGFLVIRFVIPRMRSRAEEA
jgi:hypothetical protein